jgi:hypothetical protein
MLIRGKDLTTRQKAQVKAAFLYRWTVENDRREAVWSKLGKPTMPLQTDEEWINDHAFHFIKDGSRLSRRSYAEPAYLA